MHEIECLCYCITCFTAGTGHLTQSSFVGEELPVQTRSGVTNYKVEGRSFLYRQEVGHNYKKLAHVHNALVKLMPHLPPTGDRWGLD